MAMIRTRRLAIGVAEEPAAVANPRLPRASWPAFAVPAGHIFILRDINWLFPLLEAGATMELWCLTSGGANVLFSAISSEPDATSWGFHRQADIVFEPLDELWLFSTETPFSYLLSGASLPPL